jgi:hypothetical protein
MVLGGEDDESEMGMIVSFLCSVDVPHPQPGVAG